MGLPRPAPHAEGRADERYPAPHLVVFGRAALPPALHDGQVRDEHVEHLETLALRAVDVFGDSPLPALRRVSTRRVISRAVRLAAVRSVGRYAIIGDDVVVLVEHGHVSEVPASVAARLSAVLQGVRVGVDAEVFG